MEELYTPRQVASILKIGYHKTLELLKDGSIKSIMVGKVYRVSVENLKAFIEAE
jgi:excisionase family DNA binding protein